MGFEQQQMNFWNASKLDRRSPVHPVVNAVFQPMAEFVQNAVDNSSVVSVLDVGCGNGFLQYYLEKKFQKVIGLDASSTMLEQNPCANRVWGNCLNLPFEDASFEVVCASHLLHHLSREQQLIALKEMKRVARKSIVVFEPNRNNLLTFLFALLYKEERNIIYSSKKYLRNLFKAAGITQVFIQVNGWITPNKFPESFIKTGQKLNNSPLRRMGFDLWAHGKLDNSSLV